MYTILCGFLSFCNRVDLEHYLVVEGHRIGYDDAFYHCYGREHKE